MKQSRERDLESQVCRCPRDVLVGWDHFQQLVLGETGTL